VTVTRRFGLSVQYFLLIANRAASTESLTSISCNTNLVRFSLRMQTIIGFVDSILIENHTDDVRGSKIVHEKVANDSGDNRLR